MDQAEGKYLQFVDSDDWITTDATRMMVSATEYGSCDMVITHFFRVNHDKIRRKGHIKEYEIMTRKGFAEHMMEKPANFYYGVMWNKLYRRDILNAYKLQCSRELNWCEDFLFNLQYLCYAERICA
ncbi:glycosyltransferase, partial [Hungatella sp. SL.1.14]|uniref:glycosyltransferase n=1 Tax=Hungatella sp. SL.1.14 TaxID=2963703 RepID=UPI002109FF09